MNKRSLGRSDIYVSEIAFGGVEIGMPYGIGVESQDDMLSETEAIHLLHAAVDSGINFLFAKIPAIATGPIIGKNLPSINTKPVDTFQNQLLSPSPSKPLPLLAALDVYSYNISEKP